MFFFAVLFIGLILLILWIILTLILTSNIVYYIKKKIPTYIAFPLSAFLILFIASFFTFGCGNLIPYAMQPSYHEFKQMCELNLLPNNKEKYNKILNYFNLSLETLDWKELNKKGFKLNKENSIDYVPHKVEYQVTVTRRETRRYYIAVILFANEKGFSLENLSNIKIFGTWRTGRYDLMGNEGNMDFRMVEDKEPCVGEAYYGEQTID